MRTYVVPEGATAAEQAGYAEVLAVHSALLPTGEVVYFSGDQHDPGQFAHGLFDHARVFDCQTAAVEPCTPAPSITDLFCCGHALLADGRILIAGGTLRFDGFLGSPASWIFDPDTRTFDSTVNMRDGRWYPTLLTLGNGDVLAVSGLNAGAEAPAGPEPEDQNRDLEVFSPHHGASPDRWTVQGILPRALETLYPRLHLLPDGRVLFVTPEDNGRCHTWRHGQAQPHDLCASPFPGPAAFSTYTSVLLPLLAEENYTARVLIANLPQPKLLDLTSPSPAWTNTGARHVPPDGVLTSTTPARVNGMAVLLPTGDVLSCGGEQEYGDETRPVNPLELYRPSVNSWITLPISTHVTRGYHSVALLMPDGRVWLAGSNKGCDWSFHNSADHQLNTPEPTDEQQFVTQHGHQVGVDNRELRIEIVEPWYFGRPDRPVISVSTDEVSAGDEFSVTSAQADTIDRIALVRAGSSTHGFNGDQRYVGVPFTHEDGNTLKVQLPNNQDLLPPGPYLVFALAQVIDPDSGATLDVPSVGGWIRVGQPALIKALKFEVDLQPLKLEFEHLSKAIFEVVDPFKEVVDPAELVQHARDRAAKLPGKVVGLKPFIRGHERPEAPLVSKSALAKVKIKPISKELLDKQSRMEAMHHDHGTNMKRHDG